MIMRARQSIGGRISQRFRSLRMGIRRPLGTRQGESGMLPDPFPCSLQLSCRKVPDLGRHKMRRQLLRDITQAGISHQGNLPDELIDSALKEYDFTSSSLIQPQPFALSLSKGISKLASRFGHVRSWFDRLTTNGSG